MIRAVVFDFFDVINTDPYKTWLKKHDLERTGEYLEASDHLDHGRIGLEEFFERLEVLSGHPRSTMEEEWANTQLVDEDIITFIKDLKRRYKIGLLSNAPTSYIRGLLKLRDIDVLFDHITVSSEVGKIKPTKEAYEHILNELHVAHDEAVFIDDSERNVIAAPKLGIHSILFTDTVALRSALEKVL